MSEHTPEIDAFLREFRIEGCTFRNDNSSIGVTLSNPPEKTREEIIDFARKLESERDNLRSQNAELVKALNELLYGTNCYLDTESRSVFHFTTEQLAQARAALAKAKP